LSSVTKMTAIIEASKFWDGRLMLRVRFRKDSKNVRQDGDETTWVPSYYELDLLNEVLALVDEYNSKNLERQQFKKVQENN
jgi:hypothetical protein